MTPSRSRHHKPTIVRAPSMISPTSSGGPHPNHWMLCLLSRSISHSRSSPRGPEPSHKSPIFPHSYHPFPLPPPFSPMLWCTPSPPLLRRISSKKSYSDFSLVRKVYLSRGASKQSERSAVQLACPRITPN